MKKLSVFQLHVLKEIAAGLQSSNYREEKCRVYQLERKRKLAWRDEFSPW